MQDGSSQTKGGSMNGAHLAIVCGLLAIILIIFAVVISDD